MIEFHEKYESHVYYFYMANDYIPAEHQLSS